MLRKLWHEMTTRDFAGLDPARTVAVLPVGAVEQHGPHLPVGVDTLLCQGVIDRAMAILPEDLPVTVLPTQAVGKSNEHIDFPGTLTLSAETLARVWTEIGEGVARAGIRKLVILNGHGGQVPVMEIVARELRVRRAMFVVALSHSALGTPPGLFPESELRHGIHAGARETAMMLHLHPDLVREAERRDFPPATLRLEAETTVLGRRGAGIAYGWQVQDLNPDGACGDATNADAERGRILVETAAERFVTLLREVADYPLDRLVARAPTP